MRSAAAFALFWLILSGCITTPMFATPDGRTEAERAAALKVCEDRHLPAWWVRVREGKDRRVQYTNKVNACMAQRGYPTPSVNP